jgi:hypothetical protein
MMEYWNNGSRAQKMYLVDRSPSQPNIPSIHHSIILNAEQSGAAFLFVVFLSV